MADYRQILCECAERLISTADRLTVNDSNTSQANRESNAGTSQDCEPSALEEHRRIFGYPLQLVPLKARVHRIVVVSEGAVARTLFQEILGPGLLFALRRRAADLPLPRPKGLH